MAEAKRPVGRPRANGKPPIERQQVLIKAGQLITEFGYEATSLKKLADALGTSAPALIQRFGNKAQMLNELVVMMANVSVTFHTQLALLGLAPDVRLYKMVYAETMALSSTQHAPISVFYLPELRQPEFSMAQEARANMMRFYRDVIESGLAAEQFHPINIVTAAEQVFQLTETSIIAQDKQALGLPEVLSRQTAEFALRGLLVKPRRLNQIRRSADRVELEMA